MNENATSNNTVSVPEYKCRVSFLSHSSMFLLSKIFLCHSTWLVFH